MMRNRSTQILAVLSGALLYWLIVSLVSGAAEPWDAPAYWTLAYPLALAVSAVLGFLSRLPPWAIGVILIFTQLPIMAARAEIGPLLVMGVVYLCVLTLPAIIVAWAGRRLRQRRKR